MEFHKNIPMILDGTSITVDIEVYSRGGTKSPEMEIIIYKGKRYVPYAQKKLGFQCTFNGLLKMTYGRHFENISICDSLLSKIPKDPNYETRMYCPVVLGVAHGVIFPKKEEV